MKIVLLTIVWALLVQAPFGEPVFSLTDDLLAKYGLYPVNAPQSFNRGTLFDYINGGADVYLDAGFKRCVMRHYKKGDRADIETAIYDMGTDLQAFGLFRLLHDEFRTDTASGIEMSCVTAACYFRNGRYYVTVFDRSKNSLKERELLDISRTVSFSIGKGDGSLPEAFKRFPKQSRISQSESFHATNYMARSFMRNVLTARYCPEKDTVTLFYMETTSEKEAQVFLNKLNEQFVEGNRAIVTLKPEGLPGFQADDIRIVLSGNNLIGMRGKGANTDKVLLILNEYLDHLR